MRYEAPTQEDLGPLADHPFTVPAALWAMALVCACLLVAFTPTPGELLQAQPPAATVPADSEAGRS